jgi:long-chain fatty acid transport protein
MRPRLLLLCLALGLAGADLAAASGFGVFQHGGRALGQVGAFTARADEPSAVLYNPAAITRLPGTQIQAGLDFSYAEDDYRSPTGSFSTNHIIQFVPALYATWNPAGSSLALGIGLDAPFWYRVDWEPALFPGRFLQRTFELRVAELHPVLAWDLGGGWSVGGGLRYLYGDLEQGDNGILPVTRPGGSVLPVEVERTAEAKVDAFTWDVAVHYATPVWGWGAVFRNNAELKGSGDAHLNPRDVDPSVLDAVRRQLPSGRARQSFELPREIRGGAWVAPYPELRLEADVSWQGWSSLENTDVIFSEGIFGSPRTETTRRDWKDTLGVRLGLEGDVTDAFALFGGVAWEPTPVPRQTIEPGFPRGDAIVYAAGFSYSFPHLSFDVGYSLHDHESFGARGQEQLNPGVEGSYASSDQVWGFSARWRL